MKAAVAILALLLGIADASPARSTDAALQSTIGSIARQSPLDRAQLGVLAIDAQTGKVLVARQADTPFMPASTFKALLSVAALHIVGPQFRFNTQLLARGPLENGVVDGDLILVGGGDPLLSSDDLSAAAKAVRAEGVLSVRGALLADASLFDQRRWGPDWAWDGMPFYYQAPIQALSVDEGTLDVAIGPGARTGDAVNARLISPVAGYSIESRAVMGAGPYEDPARCSRRIGTTEFVIVGRMALGEPAQTLHCTVEDSVAVATARLRAALAHEGIALGTRAMGSLPPNVPLDVIDDAPLPSSARYAGARILWAHQSPTLIEIFGRMLPKSDNFIAEHILKMLAVESLSQRGNFIGGATAVQRFAVEQAGIDKDSIDVEDGSGLSPADRITPRALVTVLAWAAKQPYGAAFAAALPRAGMDGTLAGRMAGSDAVGRVRAKSGYLLHAINLAGYAQTLHHGRVIFAVMINDATGDPSPYFDLEDQIVEAIVDAR
ncbi:MAG: D-alanyl-D-alanine carboxypeptidase/D-alanyl-D-alanine-endopeptidase [Candidatus Eremiobacteraeota bacterium]|nr:D-alanyl-D-alanine carboxypeptidase/D-alanyl-D-alanine-endopeptidase [Candidatus Eremiobacteraeota bacterium]MBV8366082.1 D-alanyl-D-alanine carboxypeptidase/D-alanyl-D-alanine-endopeptidase [Candidatus Eremiobacteraeota bacterium]